MPRCVIGMRSGAESFNTSMSYMGCIQSLLQPSFPLPLCIKENTKVT